MIRLIMRQSRGAAAALLFALGLAACGGGVPLRLRIDEFAVTIDLDESVEAMERSLKAQGVLPPEAIGLPEIWPEGLPSLRYSANLTSPPKGIDLTPEDAKQAKKYEQINKYKDAVQRIELNKLVLRLEENTTNVSLPALTLQVADTADADPDDRSVWQTIGSIPAAEPGAVTDLELEFVPGGESFLNGQLSDENKELSYRTVGSLVFDTAINDRRPRGQARARLIIVATFFITPDF